MINSRILRFPSDLRESQTDYGYSCVRFSLHARNAGTKYEIFLPMPQGFAINDSAIYSATDLGELGAVVGQMLDEKGEYSAKELANVKKLNSSFDLKSAVGGIASKIGFGKTKSAASILTKSTAAPNTNTIFENSGLRKFDFAFKLIPKSAEDAESIRTIINAFRLNLYPESTNAGITLRYPDVWQIQFYNGKKENPYISKIWKDCHLETFNTNYNSSTNMFHPDGQPVETDIAMSFSESKALHKAEIAQLLDGEKPGWTEETQTQ